MTVSVAAFVAGPTILTLAAGAVGAGLSLLNLTENAASLAAAVAS